MYTIKIFKVFLFLFVASLLGADQIHAVEPQTPPNIIVILADDLSEDVMNAVLDNNLAPNIQQYLIDEGVSFKQSFVTTALCCPSRATFLTGMYSHNHGIFSNLTPDPFKSGIAWPGWLSELGSPGQNASTLPVWLRNVNYYTGYVGKYLNGYGKVAPAHVSDPETFVPPGWDDWQGLIDPTTYLMYNYRLNDNGVVVNYGEADADYQTDVLSGRAVDFIEEASLQSKPFFLFVSTLAPHTEVTDLLKF